MCRFGAHLGTPGGTSGHYRAAVTAAITLSRCAFRGAKALPGPTDLGFSLVPSQCLSYKPRMSFRGAQGTSKGTFGIRFILDAVNKEVFLF